MGSQQLLLIVVGVVLIGIMIVVGMGMFKDQASATNRDAIANDLTHYAAQVQKYYRRPSVMGGGSNSFNGMRFQDITKKPVNANGSYVLTPDPASASDLFVTIIGTGTNRGNDGATDVQLQITIMPDTVFVETLN